MPQSLTQQTEVRTALYYTKGGIVADTPTGNALGVTTFQMSGHTGFHGIPSNEPQPLLDRLGAPATLDSFVTTIETIGLHIGQSLPVRGSLIDGAAGIKDFAETIRMYYEFANTPNTSGVTRTQDMQLEFINRTAPVSQQDRTGQAGWIIHPRTLVSIRQDATRPLLYFYTFQFDAIGPLNVPVEDGVMETLNAQKSLRPRVLDKTISVIRDLTNGVNTIRDAFDQLVIQNATGPVSTLLLSTADLTDAVQGFLDGAVAKIQFPLYAQRLGEHILDAPSHSVSTLKLAAGQLVDMLSLASLARVVSAPLAGIAVLGDTNDVLSLVLNQEDPVSLTLGTLTGGPVIAAAIQSQVRALPPQHTANLGAYREFTATYAHGQYTLASGTHLSDAARVSVVSEPDTALTPGDASATLGLGSLNGGQEHPGTSKAVRAIALLHDLQDACTALLARPDYFAAQLADQDAQLAQRQPATLVRSHIRGDQHVIPVRITPGDSLQALASRVNVPWETLALINNLTYPYILLEPSTLLTGRMSSADRYHFSDVDQTLAENVHQGQRVDLLGGAGAGQSRIILRNTATEWLIDHAWTVPPNDTTDYAIRQALNPILHTSTVTTTTARTLTDSTLALIPDTHRGLTILMATGPAAGDRRRIVENAGDSYILDAPWDVLPAPGDIYLMLVSGRGQVSRQRLLGDVLSVPRPSTQRLPSGIRGRLEDVSSITGRTLTREDKLFGRDWLLEDGALVWDPAQQDCVTIAGRLNLRQAVIHLVNLPLGQLEYQAGLGSYLQQELGDTATLPSQIQLFQSLERTLMQDARVARMAGAELFTQGGRTFVSLAVQAISGDTVDRIVVR